MATVFLVRHGRSSANTAGILAGRMGGVHLDEVGLQQAALAGRRLAGIRLSGIVTSPLERTMQTAMAILDEQTGRADIAIEPRIVECHYGTWSGKKLSLLSKKPLWKTVQTRPSAVRFPGEDGESLVGMQARALEAIGDWNTAYGARSRYAVVTHGDIIKSILADALGMHLDLFQRIAVDPGSISVVHYSQGPPMVLRMNDTDSDLTPYARPGAKVAPVVGGGAGSGSTAKRPTRPRK